MKRNRNQAVRNSSRHGAAMQSKIQKGRGKVRPSPVSPSIALFLEGDGLSEEIVDLSEAEYAALKRAAAPSGGGILMFMANLGLEKIGWIGGIRHRSATGSGSAACNHQRKTLTFRSINDSWAELAHLNLDERQSCLLKRVAAATGLTWDELFAFVLDRQLEAFFPPDDPYIFSVREDATREITINLRAAERATIALRAMAEEMMRRLEAFREKQPLPGRGFLAELPGLFSLVERLSISADVSIADAGAHWHCSARPALLESHPTPGAQAARPIDQRRAA